VTMKARRSISIWAYPAPSGGDWQGAKYLPHRLVG
jgi:hypothetical protein